MEASWLSPIHGGSLVRIYSIAVCSVITSRFRVGVAQVFEMFARPDWLCSPQAPGCLRRAPGAAEGAGDAEAAGGERVRTGQGWERDLGQLWGSAGSSLALGGFFSL